MNSHDGRIGDTPTTHTVAFFPPIRPTDGNTVYVLPDVTPEDQQPIEQNQHR